MDNECNPDGKAKRGGVGATASFTDNLPPKIVRPVKIVDGINAEIEWETNGVSAANEEFLVSWWTHEGDKRSDETKSRNYIMTKLKRGEKYSVNVAHTGQASSKASNTVPFNTAPFSPINMRAENYQPSPQDSLIVSLDDKNQRKVNHVVTVEAIDGEEGPVVKETKSRKVLVKGLTPGQTYCVSAVACDDKELQSEISFCDFPVSTYPASPKGLDFEVKGKRLTLKWERPAIRPQKYLIQWKANGVPYEEETSDETFSIDLLVPSTTYRFRIASFNDAGPSDFGDEKEYTTAPAAPVDVSVNKNNYSPESSFTVKFKDPDPLKKEYEVYAVSMEGKEINNARTSCHTAVLNGLEPGHPYYIYVVAISGGRTSEKTYFVDQN